MVTAKKKRDKTRDAPDSQEDRLEFDIVDKQILELLTDNGRMKLVDIGRQLHTKKKNGYSHVGVKKRLSKLKAREAFKIQANVNVKKMGLVFGLLLLETENYDITKDIYQRYRKCPRVVFSFQTSGKFNLVYGVLAETIRELESYLNFCSPKNLSGIRNSRVLISTTNFIPAYLPIRFVRSEKQDKPPCGTSDCAECDFYENGDCTGCPAIKMYRGAY